MIKKDIVIAYEKKLKEPAKRLRTNMTNAERVLWSKLKLKQINGYQFYRQKPIGNYIVDFYCPSAKIVIEVDGGQHFSDENTVLDKIRDNHMQKLGLRVLRFTNIDVLTNINGVIDYILSIIGDTTGAEKIPLVSPFQKGENTPSFKRKEKLIIRSGISLDNKGKGKT
jgi:very-short-patch-repair endonuclease